MSRATTPPRRAWLGLAAAAALGALPAVRRAHADGLPTRGDPVRWPQALPLLGGDTWRPPAGQAVIVVFWTTTCPFCRRHNQRIQKLHQALKGRPAQVLGAARETDAQAVRAYLQAQGLDFPVTLAWRELAAALSDRRVIPLTVTVDRDGRLREVIPGEMAESDVLGLAGLAG